MIVVLRRLISDADAVDHIGSTAVPGLPAKDCLDAMVRVGSLVDIDLGALANAGYRERPETWNRVEVLGAASYPKRVFAAPVGGRLVNIHIVRPVVRHLGTPCCSETSYAPTRTAVKPGANSRRDWPKQHKLDIYAYGQIKATAQPC